LGGLAEPEKNTLNKMLRLDFLQHKDFSNRLFVAYLAKISS